MKKCFVFVLMLTVGICMSACSSDDDNRFVDNPEPEVEKETYPLELQSLTKEECHALFQREGIWSGLYIYDVYADGTMTLIEDCFDTGFIFSVTGESTIDEYLYVYPNRELLKNTGNYVFYPETNKLSFTNMNEDFGLGAFMNEDYIVVSMTKDEFRLLLGKRFSKHSPKNAVYSMYVFKFLKSQE